MNTPDIHRPQYNPELDVCHATPADPFNYRLLQFSTLREMGYPVTIVPTSRGNAQHEEHLIDIEAGEEEGASPWREVQFKQFSQWCYPRVVDPAFLPWVEEGLAVPEDRLQDLTGTQFNDLQRHPAPNVVRQVDLGQYGRIATYLESTRKQGPPRMFQEGTYGTVLVGAYLKAHERFKEKVAVEPRFGTKLLGMSFHGGSEDEAVYEKFRDRLLGSGHKPVVVEALGSLVQDYYRLVEQTVPEFAAFGPRPHTLPSSE